MTTNSPSTTPRRRWYAKHPVIAAAVVAGAMALSGTAYAYWTNTGSGSGSAAAGSNAAITVVQTASSDPALVPGGPSSTLSGTFTNPNTSTVYVNQLTATLASVTGGGTAPNECTIADFALTTPTITIGAQVAVDDTTTWSGIQVRMLNAETNQDKCKNATIVLAYTTN